MAGGSSVLDGASATGSVAAAKPFGPTIMPNVLGDRNGFGTHTTRKLLPFEATRTVSTSVVECAMTRESSTAPFGVTRKTVISGDSRAAAGGASPGCAWAMSYPLPSRAAAGRLSGSATGIGSPERGRSAAPPRQTKSAVPPPAATWGADAPASPWPLALGAGWTGTSDGV